MTAPMRHRLLRLEPGLRVLERRRHLLPRHRPRAARARPPRHLLRARRLRAPAAPRHRRSRLGRRSSSTRPTSDRRACACARARARRRPGRQGERRRRVRRAARAAVLELQRPRTLVVVLGRRRAGDARPHRAATPHDPFRALHAAVRPGAHLRRRRAGGRGLPRARRPRVRADLQRARSRRPTIRSRRDAALRRATSASSATACPTARRASRSSSSAPPQRCRSAAFLLGGSGWDDKPMPANVALRSATSTRATTTRSTARRSRC